ncbi:MAG: hypothetical protein WC055_00025 [Melioribacteraceae bacterium]
MQVTIKQLAEECLLNGEKLGIVDANLFMKYAKANGSAKQIGKLEKRDKQRGRTSAIYEVQENISFNLTLKNPPVQAKKVDKVQESIVGKAAATAKKKVMQTPKAAIKATPKKSVVKGV